MNGKTVPKILGGFVALLAVVLVGCSGNGASISISLGEAITLSQSNSFSKVNIDTGSGTMSMTVTTQTSIPITDTNGTATSASTGTVLTANIDSLNMADLQSLGFVFPEDTSTNAAGSNLTSLLIYLGIPILFILLFMFYSRRQAAGGDVTGFNRSGAKLLSPDRPKVTFADVAGVEEAKQDLQEVVEFLKDRSKFQAIGATIPKGVLLVGPPGTGKTLLARALAGEAGVPFFSISGSEFVELFVGVGAARVRNLFSEAKKMAPCIIFIDELDAVGRQRAGNIPGSHEEREQTLNQILVEMDGFDPNNGVIVLAATNRVDVLDQALLRPGRFDRRVTLDRPDTNGRIAILKIHSKGKVIAPDVDLTLVAKQTHGFSGADLAELMNEAAIMAVRRHKTIIGMEELEDSIDRVLAGPERKSLAFRPRDKELTAYHEAGHALVARMLPNIDPVLKISIVARGSMGGYTRFLEEDRYFITESQFRSTLATFMAGHAAEQMIFDEVSTGPHGDIRQATDIARKMVTEYSMSEKLGFRTYGEATVQGYLGIGPPEAKDYSEESAKQIDEEIRLILQQANDVAIKILAENRPRLDHLAAILLTKETLEGPELEAAFTEPIPDKPEKSSNQIGKTTG
jgi:cell division protease FtsH